jgi:integrase
LTTEKRNNGPDVWVYRWRETGNNGGSIQRKRIIGTKKEYPTESGAWKALEALRLDINAESVSASSLTVGELAKHYIEKELGEACGKTAKTCETYIQHLNDYIIPRWGSERVGDIKAFRIEEWLKSLPKAAGTKAKTKAVFSVLYQHALRYGWAERNPIREVRQSAKRQREPDILTPEETSALLARLPGYARTMAVVATVTGLRRGELIGLKWEDVDFEKGVITVRRSLVDQVEGAPKTEASKRPIPLEAALAAVLGGWRRQTQYNQPSDWLFASPFNVGRTPYWPGTVLEKIIQPAAREVGIVKTVGWHTFRHTVATWLLANGESIKTSQELMRHASPSMTLGTYAQAITKDKREAQGRIGLLLGLEVGESDLATSA